MADIDPLESSTHQADLRVEITALRQERDRLAAKVEHLQAQGTYGNGMRATLNAVEGWIGEFYSENARRRDCGEVEIPVADRILERTRAYRRKFIGDGIAESIPAYRPGLPTVEQVKAHEARGGWWQVREGAVLNMLQFYVGERPHGACVIDKHMGCAAEALVLDPECRPCDSNGTPCPWPDAVPCPVCGSPRCRPARRGR